MFKNKKLNRTEEVKEIVKNKNKSLMNYIQYRTLYNIGKRTIKGDIKVFFIDLKIKFICFVTGATCSYEKRDAYTVEKERLNKK